MTQSSKGIYVVVAIFLFGGLALTGLFLAPRGVPPKVDATQPAATTPTGPTAPRPGQ